MMSAAASSRSPCQASTSAIASRRTPPPAATPQKSARSERSQSPVEEAGAVPASASSRMTSSADRQVEHVMTPRREVQVEPARDEIAARPIVSRRRQLVLEPHGAAAEVRERQTHVALALVAREVHGDEPP